MTKLLAAVAIMSSAMVSSDQCMPSCLDVFVQTTELAYLYCIVY